jgi:hypothetical protein
VEDFSRKPLRPPMPLDRLLHRWSSAGRSRNKCKALAAGEVCTHQDVYPSWSMGPLGPKAADVDASGEPRAVARQPVTRAAVESGQTPIGFARDTDVNARTLQACTYPWSQSHLWASRVGGAEEGEERRLVRSGGSRAKLSGSCAYPIA